MKRLLVLSSIAVMLILSIVSIGCLAATVEPASKEKFVAGWAFGDPEKDGEEFLIGENKWLKYCPEGLNTTGTGGATTPTPYEEVMKYISWYPEMEISLQLPSGTPAGEYIARVLICENWWADDELHRMTYNLEINGKMVAEEKEFPVNKGDFTINDYVIKVLADGLITLNFTQGTGGGTDGNLIVSGVEVMKK